MVLFLADVAFDGAFEGVPAEVELTNTQLLLDLGERFHSPPSPAAPPMRYLMS